MHVDTWCCKLITYGPVSNTCIAVYKPGYMKVCFTAYGNREHLGQPSQPYHPVVRFSGLSEETLNRDPISIWPCCCWDIKLEFTHSSSSHSRLSDCRFVIIPALSPFQLLSSQTSNIWDISSLEYFLTLRYLELTIFCFSFTGHCCLLFMDFVSIVYGIQKWQSSWTHLEFMLLPMTMVSFLYEKVILPLVETA